MLDKLNTFISNLNGQFVEVSYNQAIYQCMDLVYNWIFCLGIPKSTIQQGSAYQVWINASDLTRQYFDLIPNEIETIPQAGDLVVWNNKYGSYGHIAIIISATKTTMKVFEQNNPLGTNAHIQDRTYTNVYGFLRPKVTINGDAPSWLSTLLQERGLTLNDESQIRVLFEKAKKYDDDIKVLQEQVKSANETLSDKSIEVSGLITDKQKLTDKVLELEELYSKAKIERDEFERTSNNFETKLTISEEALLSKENDLDSLRMQYNALKEQSMGLLTTWELIKLIFKRR